MNDQILGNPAKNGINLYLLDENTFELIDQKSYDV
jgi:hypothetical protein